MSLENRIRSQRRVWSTRSFRVALSSVFIGAAFLVLFQNCSQPVADTGVSQIQSLANKTNFSYDANFDQIAYMSCPMLGASADPDMFYTFRAGAYRTGGIGLTTSFFQTYSKKTAEAMADILTLSPAHKSTALQLAVRQKGSLNSLVLASGSAKKGVDYSNLLVELGTSEMAAHMIAVGVDLNKGLVTGKKTRYMRDGTDRGQHFEGSLYFGTSEALASDLRENYLNSGRAWLTLTYVEPAQGGSRDTDVRTPYTVWPTLYTNDAGVAYGKAFSVSFDKPIGAKGLMERVTGTNALTGKELSSAPLNQMTTITERNLVNGADSSNLGIWTCPATMKLRIVRPEDLTEGTCRRIPDPDDSKITAEHKLARNSLRVEDWYIDWDNKCIVPKKPGSCYGDLNYVQYAYTSGEGCDKNSTTSSNGVLSKVCMAWVSVCYRPN